MHMESRIKEGQVVGAAGAVPLWLIEAVSVSRDQLLVRFRDGFVRAVTREEALSALPSPVAAELRDPDVFAAARFDPDVGTVTWPNGADLAPEFLRWGNHLQIGCPCQGGHGNGSR
jgi:hypothetical protein